MRIEREMNFPVMKIKNVKQSDEIESLLSFPLSVSFILRMKMQRKEGENDIHSIVKALISHQQ